MRRWNFLFTLAAVATLAARAEADALNPPFDPAYARQVAGGPVTAPFQCRPVPPPTLDMSGLESRYVKDDPTQSRIDPANAAKEAARGKVLWDYVMQLGRLGDQYMLSTPARPEIAECVIRHLAAWARAGALTRNIEQNHEIGRHQAIMLQAWSLAGFTFAYMKLGERAPSDDTRDILQWFKVLSDSAVREFSDRRNKWYQKRSSNHGLWAGLAVANSGIILNDKSKLDFGLTILRAGLAAAAADGRLPEEMARGERAMLYQSFATMAIMGLVAIADANGSKLNATEEDKLARIARFNIEARSATANGDAAAGRLPKHVDKSALGWAEIAICHFDGRNRELADQIDSYVRTLRPVAHVYYGGSATAAFNPAALPGAHAQRRCPARPPH
jgi:poly(beta-D-mannuronate) lyase